MSTKNRSFRLASINPNDNIDFGDGIYNGRGPGQAALKAFNWYCRKADLSPCIRRFSIEEITRDKPRKQFHYVGTRKELQPPKEIQRDGKTYFVRYESTVRKDSKSL